MAIDTRSRRASVLGLGMAVALTLPLPDGTVGQEDRQHVAFAYAGLSATEEEPPVVATITVSGSYTPRVSVAGAFARSIRVSGSLE